MKKVGLFVGMIVSLAMCALAGANAVVRCREHNELMFHFALVLYLVSAVPIAVFGVLMGEEFKRV